MQRDYSVIANTLKQGPVIGWQQKNWKYYFLKSNRELWENSQQLISRTISMSKMENIRAHKRIEEDETEEKRMNGDNN